MVGHLGPFVSPLPGLGCPLLLVFVTIGAGVFGGFGICRFAGFSPIRLTVSRASCVRLSGEVRAGKE